MRRCWTLLAVAQLAVITIQLAVVGEYQDLQQGLPDKKPSPVKEPVQLLEAASNLSDCLESKLDLIDYSIGERKLPQINDLVPSQ